MIDKIIFLAIAKHDHEGYDVIKAFSKEEAAINFVQECEEYNKSRTDTPDIEASEKDWEKWGKINDPWIEAHPAGKIHSNPDGYSVLSTSLL